VRILFRRWVQQADTADNGEVVIALDAEPNPDTGRAYSRTTVNRAVRWLTAHNLLVQTQGGGGRGRHSRYRVVWSRYGSLTQRQRQVNHGMRETVHRASSIEEQTTSSLRETPRRCHGFDRAHRWAAATLARTIAERLSEELTSVRLSLKAATVGAVYRALDGGHVRPGPELGALVMGICAQIGGVSRDPHHALDPETPQFAHSWAAWLVQRLIRGEPVQAQLRLKANPAAPFQRQRQRTLDDILRHVEDYSATIGRPGQRLATS